MGAALEQERAALKRDLALGYKLFAALGWGDLGDGHISARDPERADCFWVLADGTPFPQASVDDLVLIGPDGAPLAGPRGANAPAYFIHWPILAARPDILSAAHTHTPHGTPFAAEARGIEPITQEACVFFEDCAVFDDDEVQVQSIACGGRIAQALGRRRGLVLRNHGLLTVGATVREAVAWFVTMERVAQAHLTATAARPIDARAARFAKADLGTPRHARRVFDFLVGHHLGQPVPAATPEDGP